MLPRRTSVLRANTGDGEFIITPQRSQLSKLARVRTGYAIDKFSPVSRQLVQSQNRYVIAKASMNSPSISYSRPMVQFDTARSRLNDEVSTTRASCSRGSMRIPIVKSYSGGRYLLRIPRNESGPKEDEHVQDDSLEQYPAPYQKRLVIPTVPPSMSMGGEYPADQYELVYESDEASSPTSLAERDTYDTEYSPAENRKRFFCSEMTCFWHGPTHASLRRHMMVTHSRGAVNHADARNLSAQAVRRSTKPKGVKCSECGQMAYSRPLLLRHMTQIHGIVAPLIYKTFSDRESLQNWLEQLRETHAVEFVVSSGSKKWGQGLQVHYLTCSRSGEQKERPNKKYRRPTRPSIKCGKNCMAYLKMKQNPTVSELKIEACLHHSGHEIDASKIRLEQNEWCRVIQLIREIDEGLLQVDVKHITRIREILGNNGRFRLMTDEGLCQQLPKWIEEYMQQEELDRCAPGMEQEDEEKGDPLLCDYETNLSVFPEDFLDYKMEPIPYDDYMCDLESTNKVAVNG